MIQIPYTALVTLISVLWILTRAYYAVKNKGVNWAREAKLLLVYICIVVVVRCTFIPFSKVDGKLQPLLFDGAQIFPPRINLIPVVYLFDYPVFREALLNFIGNTTMFIPLGIVFPILDRRLNTHAKAMAAGMVISMCIEILQLPFFDRVSDIDDLLLNSLGYVTGYGIYLLVKLIASKFRKKV